MLYLLYKREGQGFMTTHKLPKGFFNDVPVKTKPSRSDDSHETPVSLSRDVIEGNRKIRVVLVEKNNSNKK